MPVVALLVGCLLSAEPIPAEALPVLQKLYDGHVRAIAGMEGHLKLLKEPVRIQDRVQRIRTVKANRERAKELKAEIAEAKTGETGPLYPKIAFPLQAGQFGKPNAPALMVQQVVGPNEALVVYYHREQSPPAIVGETRPTTTTTDYIYLLRGVDTTGQTDETPINLPQLIEVDGNFTYTTVAGGTKTVLVIKAFDASEAVKYWRQFLAEKAGKK